MEPIKFYDPRLGAFSGLSNLHLRPVHFGGQHYATPEHAYQVAKARDVIMRDWLAQAPTPELVAIAGDALTVAETVENWEETHIALMEEIVRAKFDQHADLRALLLSTGTAKIVEWVPEDSPVARFWGEYQGQGTNTLGRMLMRLREEYRVQGASV